MTAVVLARTIAADSSSDCLVHRCDHPPVVVFATDHAAILWRVCAQHEHEIAQLLGIPNQAKESR